MKRKTLVAFVSLAAVFSMRTREAEAADRFQSGQWEVTVSEKGSPAHTHTHCDTPAQVKGSNGSIDEVRASLEKGALDSHCALKDFKMEADTIAYTYACAGRSTESTTTYHGDSYESVVTSTGPTGVHVRQIKGRRLGQCP